MFNNGILAGLLTETDNGTYEFSYDELYFLDETKSSIGLSFPKNQRKFMSKELFPFFYNMLSEGTNKAIQCRSLKIDENDAFGLLMATAHTDTIGAITVKKL